LALTVTVLGCSGTYAAPGGACSGYLFESAGCAVWVDCGAGTLANLQRHVTLADLDAIVISHSHPDHWTELPVVRNALKYAFDRTAMPAFGTAETLMRAEGALGEPLAPTLAWTVIDETSTVTVGPFVFTFSRTDHPVETLAVRAESAGGGSAVYSADTGPAWEPGPFAAADLFVCEATLTPEFEGGPPHLSARQAGAVAKRSGARRLVITHHWPGADLDAARLAAAAAYGGPVELATVHARYEIP
jgi:ribonuclease BN (tRNA processing enzyme)